MRPTCPSPRLLLLGFGLAVFVAAGRAQFSYDFNATTTDYFSYSTTGNGYLDPAPVYNFFETSGVSVDDDDAVLVYRHHARLDGDWSASVTVLLPENVSGASMSMGQEVEIGISLFLPGGGDTGNDIDVKLGVSNPLGLGEERKIYSEYSDRNDQSSLADFTTIQTVSVLSLSYDFASGMLTASYNGNPLSSHDLFDVTSGWDVTTASWVGIAISAGSEGIDSLNENRPGFVNFTTSVVPEPGSYAWISGALALVGAVGRRRR